MILLQKLFLVSEPLEKKRILRLKMLLDFLLLIMRNTNTTFDEVIIKLGNLESINYVKEAVEGALTFRVKSNEYFIPMAGSY